MSMFSGFLEFIIQNYIYFTDFQEKYIKFYIYHLLFSLDKYFGQHK